MPRIQGRALNLIIPHSLLQGHSFTPEIRKIVIPAKAGIQSFQDLLDSRLRGNDKARVFFKALYAGMTKWGYFSKLSKRG